jgi:hypothetical protein
VAGLSGGAAEFAALAKRLKEAGETGLRKDLYSAVNDAVEPLQREIGDASHLRPYVPDRYAPVLADDLAVTVSKLTGRNPGVRVTAKGRAKKRKVQTLDAGVVGHPLFGDRGRWYKQRAGMRAGFFTDPAQRSGPRVRDAIVKAMHEVAAKITKG